MTIASSCKHGQVRVLNTAVPPLSFIKSLKRTPATIVFAAVALVLIGMFLCAKHEFRPTTWDAYVL